MNEPSVPPTLTGEILDTKPRSTVGRIGVVFSGIAVASVLTIWLAKPG